MEIPRTLQVEMETAFNWIIKTGVIKINKEFQKTHAKSKLGCSQIQPLNFLIYSGNNFWSINSKYLQVYFCDS